MFTFYKLYVLIYYTGQSIVWMFDNEKTTGYTMRTKWISVLDPLLCLYSSDYIKNILQFAQKNVLLPNDQDAHKMFGY